MSKDVSDIRAEAARTNQRIIVSSTITIGRRAGKVTKRITKRR